MIQKASKQLGEDDDFKLLASMVTSKPYEKMIGTGEKDLKKRLTKYSNQGERDEIT